MKAIFVELPPFERNRQDYLNDENFHAFQNILMQNPEAGDVIEGTGGLRKIRYTDEKRGKGKRGGLRVIYYCGYRVNSFGCLRSLTKTKWMI